MTIKKIKEEMKKYRDFYGGDFLDASEIDKAESKKDLAIIVEKHRDHMESMLADANSHLDDFKRRVGLLIYQW